MGFLILLGALLLALSGQADAQRCVQCMAAQPIAANCIAGYQWTYLNGYWRCARPSPPPAPTCPTGYEQNAAPVWNGSSWVGLGCALPPPAQSTPDRPTLPQIATICGQAVTALMAPASIRVPMGSWGTWQGPSSSDVPPQMEGGGYVFLVSNKYSAVEDYAGPEDVYWAPDTGNRASGSTGSGGTAVCYFQTGTATLIGVMYAYIQGYDGG
jgi:hypothetical protein